MLKWAVNCPRQSYLQNDTIAGASSHENVNILNRNPFNLNTLRQKTLTLDKGSQYTSTPLHISSRRCFESPSYNMDSLKNLSNIVPELILKSPRRLSVNVGLTKNLKASETTQTGKNLPSNYASTLPTFDVEYSPCALIPGPMLALRGVGIPDSYFKKPRYLTVNPNKRNLSVEVSLETKSLEFESKLSAYIEESPTHSNEMGDATLEQMIDAILESSHNKKQNFKQHPDQQNSKSSPTYTPAEDPASDLHEVWDSENSRYRPREQQLTTKSTRKSLFTEREVCTAQLQKFVDRGQLMRQGGLRRKPNFTQVTTGVVNSAQKCLAKGINLYSHGEIHQHKRLRIITPDSSHNSLSNHVEV